MSSVNTKRFFPLLIAVIMLISVFSLSSVQQNSSFNAPHANVLSSSFQNITNSAVSGSAPYVVGSNALNFQNNISLNFSASVYLYGYSTSGISEASPFLNGSFIEGLGANGYNDTGMAIAHSPRNSYDPYTNSHYTIGGVGVSGFTNYSTYYKVNTPPVQPTSTVNLTFNVTSYSLVVFMGMGGGAYFISFSGIPNMKIDSILNQSGGVGLEIAHAYLSPGTYTVMETSTNYDGGSTTRSEILSVTDFTHQTKYAVTFAESGLPSGTTWYVNLSNGQKFSSASNTTSFSETNGTYSFAIGNVSGYQISPLSGSIKVSGNNVTNNITFTAKSTLYGLSNTEIYYIFGAVLAVAVIGSALTMRRKK